MGVLLLVSRKIRSKLTHINQGFKVSFRKREMIEQIKGKSLRKHEKGRNLSLYVMRSSFNALIQTNKVDKGI